MKKIAIIGNVGSGKSTLAIKLHQILKLPIMHLDQYCWKPNWQKLDNHEYEKIHDKLCDQQEWIMEGMNTRILDYRFKSADLIIFLDIPRYICILRILKRTIKNLGKVRSDSALGCYDKISPRLFEVLKFTWNFDTKQRLRIDNAIQNYKDQRKIIIIKKELDMNKLLQNIKNL